MTYPSLISYAHWALKPNDDATLLICGQGRYHFLGNIEVPQFGGVKDATEIADRIVVIIEVCIERG